MTSMIKADDNLLAFFERPIAAVLGAVTILIWMSPLIVKLWHMARGHTGNRHTEGEKA